MRLLLALAPLLLLVSCMADSQPSIHEVNIVGSEYARVTWFYGEPRELEIGSQSVTLTREPNRAPGQLVVNEALSVNGLPFLREPLVRLQRAPTEARYVGGSSDMRVVVGQDAAQVLYWDGDMWFTLLEDASAGVNTRVVPIPRLSGLQGLAQLTRAEATALDDYLTSGTPVVLTVLDVMPSPARVASGVDEYLRSGFYLQRQIGTLAAETGTRGSEVFFDILGGGNQALAGSGSSYSLIGDAAGLREAWNNAHGSLLTPPPVPSVDFARETVLALFMGSQSTGGYGISLERMSEEGGEIFADVRLSEPGPGDITTQALTSPWQMVRILRGNVNAVWLRNADTGEILGVAGR